MKHVTNDELPFIEEVYEYLTYFPTAGRTQEEIWMYFCDVPKESVKWAIDELLAEKRIIGVTNVNSEVCYRPSVARGLVCKTKSGTFGPTYKLARGKGVLD